MVKGIPEFAVGLVKTNLLYIKILQCEGPHFLSFLPISFMDKIYILSSQNALQKFTANPRCYLVPPIPHLPCRVSVIGPRCTGKSTICALLAEYYGAVVVDVEALMERTRSMFTQDMLDKVHHDATLAGLEKVRAKMQHEATDASGLKGYEDANLVNLPNNKLHGMIELTFWDTFEMVFLHFVGNVTTNEGGSDETYSGEVNPQTWTLNNVCSVL